MNYYIKINNGKPVGLPISQNYLLELVPNIDLNNLPDDYAIVNVTEQPPLGPNQISTGFTYELVNSVLTQVWNHRDLTPEEQQLLTETGTIFKKPYPSWTLDSETGRYVAPINPPNDGKVYSWDEDTLSWKLSPEQPAPYPQDGHKYILDIFNMVWVPTDR